MTRTTLARWTARSDRFWDLLLAAGTPRPAGPVLLARRTRLAVEALEDRVVPTGRPLPLPFVFAGAGSGAPPTVKAYHADTGVLAFERTPFSPDFTGGVRVAAGDIDRDGLPDLVCAAGPGGGPRVVVYSGKDGSVLRDFFAYDPAFTGGVSVAAGDVDGDGVADVITAAGAGGGPHVKAFSGTDGSLLANFFAFAPNFRGGATVAAADFTGDGKADLAVGAGPGGGPHVRVFDVGTGKPVPGPVGSFFAFAPDFRGGVEVGTDALAGDVTGDGKADVVVGRGAGAGSLVRVFDGVTAKVALEFSPFGPGMTAGVRVATAFVDDDPYADVIVGTGAGPASTVKVFGGKTGVELAAPMSPYAPFGAGHTGGVYVAGSNDPPAPTYGNVSSPDAQITPADTYTLVATFHEVGHAAGDSVHVPTGTVTVTLGLGGPALGSAALAAGPAPEFATATVVVPPGSFPLGSYSTYSPPPIIWNYSGDSWFAASQGYAPPLVVGAVRLKNRPDPTCPPGSGLGGAPGTANNGGVTRLRGGADDRGTVTVTLAGVAGDGFGSPLASPVRWSNAFGYADQAAGSGTQVGDLTRVADAGAGDGTLAVITSPSASVNFTKTGSTFAAQFGSPTALTLDATAHEYTVTGGDGSTQVFYDLDPATPAGRRGKFKSRTDAAGNATAVTAWDASDRPLALEKTDAATGATERVAYTYAAGGQIASIVRSRKPGGGAFAVVRTTTLTYATPAGASAPALVGTAEADAAGATLGETYNRYYAGGTSAGYPGALQYHLGETATAQLKQAYAGTALAALTDAQVAAYADNAFEYDVARRVTKAVTAGAGCSACSGGQGTSLVQYAANAGGSGGANEWKAKVTETLDDGTVTRKYANANGQTMLAAVTEPGGAGRTWLTYTRFNADGQIALTAAPSAVTGYDEALLDLVGYGGGTAATYLGDTAGLITTYAYAAATTATDAAAGDVTGYVTGASVQNGETGTAVQQSAATYIARTAGGSTKYHPAAGTQYRNADGTGGQTTTTAYTWQGATHQVASATTTRPAVTAAQDGPGTAAAGTVVSDGLGRAVWGKDAVGVLTYTAYDAGTGTVVKSIADVNVANTADFVNLPSGWTTPGGAGLHLVSTYEVDSLGRTTKSVDPLGHVAYTVYNDAAHEVRSYPGWNATTNLPTGPTAITRDDRANGYRESLTTSTAPAVVGGRPTGAEAVANVESLTRTYRNAAGQNTATDTYFDTTGVTYSAAPNLGTQNVNYYRTQTAYDKKGQVNKAVSAAGTITRTERDSLGRAVSTWVGTNDVPTAGYWSAANTAGTDMVKVTEVEYDGGAAGDSNATKVTQYPGGAAAARITQTWFDWRDRPVAVKAGVEATESASVNRPISYADYDNLGQVVTTRVYDGDAVTVTTTAGVPVAPAAGLLRAQSTTAYDELGRAYQTQTFGVDPATGAVSTAALTQSVWFDLRGLTLKTLAPGGLVRKTAYDSLGRAAATYATDGGGDPAPGAAGTWAAAGDVVGDAVLSQSETAYDANGNVVLSTRRDRFHDEAATGALGTPTAAPKARVSYSAAYYDLAERTTDAVEVGTNGGAAYARPAAVPARSDTALVSSVSYDSAGRAFEATDPRGLRSRTTYDARGRTLKTVENYVDGVPSDLDDKTTEYAYGPAGMTSLTARLTGGGGQTTQWAYGVTTATGSGINSNDAKGATRWPDPTTGAASAAQQETATVNALGQPLTSTDRNGTTHAVSYDALGRATDDAVTLLGVNVDGAVRRVHTDYDGQGNAYLMTNYSAAIGGTVVSQVQRAYNGLGQLTAEYQAHGAAVDTATTPKVQYAYSALDASNRSRPVSVTYPNGRVVTSDYGTLGQLNDAISRLGAITDGATTLEGYAYLGVGTVVTRSHPQPGIDLAYVKRSGETNGDAGDPYTGLDRFGRVVDQRWVVAATGVSADRFGYTLDRDGNRLTRSNGVNAAFGEAYTYDGLNQVANFARGAHTQSWDYDALGNWDGVTTDGSTQTRTANAQNEITAISGATTPTYDANGNMTTDETGRQFAYDAWNRLKVVKDSAGVVLETLGYDALSRRITAVGATTTDLYYSSGWQVVEERVAGVARASYVWSPVYVDALVARDRDADGAATNGLEERLYALADANYNVTGLVTTVGVVVERYAYDPFGEATVYTPTYSVLPSSGYAATVLFQGLRQDRVSGLYYARNRDYSPTLGRWVTLDPIRFAAGDMNFYRMENDNPLGATDSSGLCAPPAVAAAAAPAVAVAAATSPVVIVAGGIGLAIGGFYLGGWIESQLDMGGRIGKRLYPPVPLPAPKPALEPVPQLGPGGGGVKGPGDVSPPRPPERNGCTPEELNRLNGAVQAAKDGAAGLSCNFKPVLPSGEYLRRALIWSTLVIARVTLQLACFRVGSDKGHPRQISENIGAMINCLACYHKALNDENRIGK